MLYYKRYLLVVYNYDHEQDCARSEEDMGLYRTNEHQGNGLIIIIKKKNKTVKIYPFYFFSKAIYHFSIYVYVCVFV